LRTLVRTATVLVYCQLLLGALVRHVDGAALVCHLDVVLCRGHLWPGWDWTAKLQMLHRMNAVAILLTTSTTALAAIRGAKGAVRALAIAAPILVVVQIALGVLSIRWLLEAHTVTAHLGVAAAIFADHVCLWILTLRPPVPAPAEPVLVEAHA
jgi:heme A synthase